MLELDASAPLTLAAAMTAGVIAQALAQRARIPGIVLLLVAGVGLGPDGLGLIQPAQLGGALSAIVGFGVAVILFEGGLNQNIARLRREAVPIRRLVTIGALITAAGGAIAAHTFLEWGWRISVLFGSLVVVTGPTVITPMLRRLKVVPSVETVLEAEGIFIDAFGALLAVAALGFVISPAPTAESLGSELLWLGGRLGVGAAIGGLAGMLLLVASGSLRLLPRGLENIFALSLVILAYHVADMTLGESGIPAAIAAGMVVGNSRNHPALSELVEFKEQLTVLLIAILFVLLAADVRIAEIVGLGWGAVAVLAVLMLVVRPLNVAVCTIGTDLGWRERLFIGWLAPRGIVAAAVASLFAGRLQAAGIDGGIELRAAVFAVIAATVAIQGLSGAPLATALGVRRGQREGFAIIGGNGIGRLIAKELRDHDRDVLVIDANPQLVQAAEREGLDTIQGNALRYSVLARARVGRRQQVACVTPNDKLNYMVGRLVVTEHGGDPVAIAITGDDSDLTERVIDDRGDQVMFGGIRDIFTWASLLRSGQVETQRWRGEGDLATLRGLPPSVLPLVIHRAGGDGSALATGVAEIKIGDELVVLVTPGDQDEAQEALREAGLERIE